LTGLMSLEQRRQIVGFSFVTPTLLIIALILLYPVAQSVVLSLGDNGFGGMEEYSFVGLSHYAALLENDRFWNSLSVTFIFTLVSIPLELVLGVSLALLMNESFRGKGFARLAVLFPWALPTALNALMWRSKQVSLRNR
jgi:multiple sugar transport system permease protein